MKKNQQLKKRKKILYELMCCKEYEPMRARDLAVLLQIPSGKREELHKILDLLLAEGKITISKRGKYEAVRNPEKKQERSHEKREKELKEKGYKGYKKGHSYTGTFISHPRGFGFVEIPGEEEKQDIFIPEDQVGRALH